MDRRVGELKSAVSPTSASIGRDSHDRRWLCATPTPGRGRSPRPPKPRAKRAAASRGRLNRYGELLEQAPECADGLGGDLGVERCGVELLVAKQHLDHADVDLLLKQMGGETILERVEGGALVAPRRLSRGVSGAVELVCRQRLHRIAARKQPALCRAAFQ